MVGWSTFPGFCNLNKVVHQRVDLLFQSSQLGLFQAHLLMQALFLFLIATQFFLRLFFLTFHRTFDRPVRLLYLGASGRISRFVVRGLAFFEVFVVTIESVNRERMMLLEN